ncbi:MAG: DUF2490 domain-containing protein [Flavobacteriales bacterium]
MVFGNHRLTNHWGFNTEYQWRRTNGLLHWQQSLFRTGIDFYGKRGLQLTIGYAWIKTFPYGEQPVSHVNDEHRIWQQVLMKSMMGRCEVQHRFRCEQRLLENWVITEDGNYLLDNILYRQRARYRVMITVPLSKAQLADKTLFLTASDEVFLGFGKGIGKNVLDQNRLAVAFGWRFNAACNIQLGYLNQYIIKKDGVMAERNHTLQLGMTYNLDWRKKEE